MPYAAIIAAAVAIGAAAVSYFLSQSDSEKEKQARRRALAEYAALAPPEERELIARGVAHSEMAEVQRNQGLEATQDEVLAGLMETARDGESARARAEYEQSAMDSAQLARSQRMGAVESASARGMGPDAAYTDLLLAGQGDADRERMAGLQRAAYGEEARLGALSQAGAMAAQRSATQWDQDAEVARAKDELARFNAGEWNDMQRYNDQGRYAAFNARLAVADRKYRGAQDEADMYAQSAQNTRDMGAAIGGGANKGITAGGMMGGQSAPSTASAASTRQQPAALMGPRDWSASAYSPSSYGAVGSSAALGPAMEQQRLIQTGTPTTTPTRRKAR